MFARVWYDRCVKSKIASVPQICRRLCFQLRLYLLAYVRVSRGNSWKKRRYKEELTYSEYTSYIIAREQTIKGILWVPLVRQEKCCERKPKGTSIKRFCLYSTCVVAAPPIPLCAAWTRLPLSDSPCFILGTPMTLGNIYK